jgi:hypothetical protein
MEMIDREADGSDSLEVSSDEAMQEVVLTDLGQRRVS